MPAPVRIYTRRGCGWCEMALDLLRKKGVAFEHVDASGDQALRQWLAETTGQSTVPQIFIADRPIGGYSELSALDRAGELDRMLAAEITPSPSSPSE